VRKVTLTVLMSMSVQCGANGTAGEEYMNWTGATWPQHVQAFVLSVLQNCFLGSGIIKQSWHSRGAVNRSGTSNERSSSWSNRDDVGRTY